MDAQNPVLTHLSWYWIVIELLLPPIVALLLAYPFWRKGGMIFGNITGTAVIFATAFGLIMREYIELDRLTKACLEDGTMCWPDPSPFTRFAIYASIALVEVFCLFAFSLTVERKLRDRDYAPEWR